MLTPERPLWKASFIWGHVLYLSIDAKNNCLQMPIKSGACHNRLFWKKKVALILAWPSTAEGADCGLSLFKILHKAFFAVWVHLWFFTTNRAAFCFCVPLWMQPVQDVKIRLPALRLSMYYIWPMLFCETFSSISWTQSLCSPALLLQQPRRPILDRWLIKKRFWHL